MSPIAYVAMNVAVPYIFKPKDPWLQADGNRLGAGASKKSKMKGGLPADKGCCSHVTPYQ